MTTILAYRDMMVADSCVSEAGVRYHAKKIYAFGGNIVGCSGCTIYINEFFRQMGEIAATGGTFHDLKAPVGIAPEDDDGDPEFSAIVLNTSGLFAFGIDFAYDQVDGLYHAIGSGRKAALGALRMMQKIPQISVDPVLAVEAACDVDVFSAGPVHSMSLETMELKRHVAR
jgi:ATP-dependent protease HslVU (ClpYQ) peptidase subunit